MTEILLDKEVRESKDGKSCVYVLEDEDRFSQLGYKVMMSQKTANLLRAAKIRHNGRTELIYITKGCQPFSSIVLSLGKERVLELCSNVMQAILNVKNQGFLICENIDISLDRIYFDAKTHEVRLVYLPLGAGDENQEIRFEAAVRQLLVQMIEQAGQIRSEHERVVLDTLSGGCMGLEGIAKLLQGSEPAAAQGGKTLVLVSMNPNLQLEARMKGSQMSIGRKKTNDLVLDFSNRISRLHCILHKEGHRYLVQDEESSFGTGLNGKMLTPKQPAEIREGDVLMLPGIQFKVKLV